MTNIPDRLQAARLSGASPDAAPARSPGILAHIVIGLIAIVLAVCATVFLTLSTRGGWIGLMATALVIWIAARV